MRVESERKLCTHNFGVENFRKIFSWKTEKKIGEQYEDGS